MNKIIIVGERRMGMSFAANNIIERINKIYGDKVGWLNDNINMFEGLNKNER